MFGGTALGLSYTPPIQTLVSWFSDKKGTASGITIAGFGSGALLFTPAMQSLMQKFSTLPEYVGPAKDFSVNMVNGQLFVDMNGKAVQVVEALSSDIAKLPYEGLQEGLYVVGSGSTGAAEALAVMVIAALLIYLLLIMISLLFLVINFNDLFCRALPISRSCWDLL